jgi:phosphoglycolate phosphatase-like HAD superfamily hydrolase
MRIGIDFDNTIACYEGVFHAAALERGLIPAGLARDKNSVRDHLNGSGRKDDFTELQGYVYGARMDLVSPFPGFAEFIGVAKRAGHELFIVSHKTRHPITGPKHDMHAAARGFLVDRGLIGQGAARIAPDRVFFELTKEEKVARAADLRINMFIDDLPEILAMPGFPLGMRKILFDPDAQFVGHAEGSSNLDRRSSWAAISADIAREQG